MEQQNQKCYHCKHCSKTFSNSRVLGGHTRSHVTRKPSPTTTQLEADPSDSIASAGQPGTYGLRENPKKSWKATQLTHILPPVQSTDRPLPVTSSTGLVRSDEKENRVLPSTRMQADILHSLEPFCPVRQKRTPRVCYDPPPHPPLVPEELPKYGQPQAPSATFESEDDVVEFLATTIVLMSRRLRNPGEEYVEEEIPPPDRVDPTVKNDGIGEEVVKLNDNGEKSKLEKENKNKIKMGRGDCVRPTREREEDVAPMIQLPFEEPEPDCKKGKGRKRARVAGSGNSVNLIDLEVRDKCK